MAQQARVGQGGVKVAAKVEESEDKRKSLGDGISSLGSGVRKGFGQMQRPQLWGKRSTGR